MRNARSIHNTANNTGPFFAVDVAKAVSINEEITRTGSLYMSAVGIKVVRFLRVFLAILRIAILCGFEVVVRRSVQCTFLRACI